MIYGSLGPTEVVLHHSIRILTFVFHSFISWVKSHDTLYANSNENLEFKFEYGSKMILGWVSDGE